MNDRDQRSVSRRRRFPWPAAFLLLALAVSGQLLIKAETRSKDDELLLRFYDVFTEAYYKVTRTYVDDVDPQVLLNGALKGMIQTLDEHSQYLNPDALVELEKDTGGEFSGIGIHISIRNGLLTVVAPIPGSPSAKLGLQPWDRIIEIDGESTEGITITEAVKKLTGPPGTKVHVKIFRSGEPEPLEYDITRANIKIRSVYHQIFDDDGIGYVRLARFSENTTTDLKKALLEFKEKNVKGIILDLRFNSGGLLNSAVEVADLFVPKGLLIVSTRGRLSSQNAEYRAEQDPIVDVPLIVLINEASASASEIVAGAIKDHKLGVLVGPKGKRTFGKGSVQSIETLEHILQFDQNGNPQPAALRLTTAKYYTPSGQSIHKKGIAPDVEIDTPKDFNGKLMMHGMLGDPSQEIPKDKLVTLKDVKEFKSNGKAPAESGTPAPAPDQNSPDAAPTFHDQPIEDNDPLLNQLRQEEMEEETGADTMDEGAEGSEAEPFVDIQLEEARKLLKSLLIIAERYRS
ncbi:MAG: hypothetical protein Kow0059_11760 [Candidatus Sumerlaeia bacterium]